MSDGINLVECLKCGARYNAAIPTPHVCGPTAPVMARVEPSGVNMTTCSQCGNRYNAALPPGSHQCLVALSALSNEPELLK